MNGTKRCTLENKNLEGETRELLAQKPDLELNDSDGHVVDSLHFKRLSLKHMSFCYF